MFYLFGYEVNSQNLQKSNNMFVLLTDKNVNMQKEKFLI